MPHQSQSALFRFLSVILLSLGIVGSASAQDANQGRDLFATCSGCHAVPFASNVYPTYKVPRLGGQHPAYIVDALKGYMGDNRVHETMKANVANLDDDMMTAISDYLYSATRDKPVALNITGDPEKGKALTGSCAACHGDAGQAMEGLNFPKLAGQHESYLFHSLKAYQSGERKNAIMNAAQLQPEWTDEDLLNIAAYYASLEGLTTVDFDGND